MKAMLTDNAFTVPTLGVQIFGGHGYIGEWGMEQLVRDARITMLYEGTNGIQALDLLGRKVVQQGGAGLALLTETITATTARAAGTGWTAFAVDLHRAVDRLAAVTATLWGTGDPELALANASAYLEAAGHIVVAWLWLEQALATGTTDTAVLHIDQVKTVQKQTPTITVLANMWEILTDYQYSVYIVPTSQLKDDPATPESIVRALIKANRAMYDPANRQKIIDLGVTQTKEAADVVAETFDTLVKARAWPQNEGLLKANIEGTIASEKGFGKITKDLKFDDVTDLTIVKKVVEQLGRVKDFPY